MELDLNGTDVLRPGDKGYNGDTEGSHQVVGVTDRQVLVTHKGRVIKLTTEESREQDWRWFRDPAPGTRVRSGAADGVTFGRTGVVVPTPKGASPKRTWIRWEGNVMANGYPEGHEVLECLQEIER